MSATPDHLSMIEVAAASLAAKLRACGQRSFEIIEDADAGRVDEEPGCVMCYFRVAEGDWISQAVQQVPDDVEPEDVLVDLIMVTSRLVTLH